MGSLGDSLRRLFRCLSMNGARERAVDASIDAVDHRLTDVEGEQREIAARLRILEKQSDPWGINRDE